jgi:glc operon protein GlcG
MTQRILVLALAIQSVATLLLATLVVAPRGAAAPAPQEAASVAPAPPASVAEQRIRVTNSLSLGEARAIVDAAVAYVRAENGRTAIAVVDDHGDLLALDRMDGTSATFGKFAVGKARGAVALQAPTSDASDQFHTQPQRFFSALSMLNGEVLLIPGGIPLIVDGVVVGAVGSAGHGPNGDIPAVEAGIAAWQRYRQSMAR